MNVYFMDSCLESIDENKLNILFELLKIKQTINLRSCSCQYPLGPLVCQSMLIYKRKEFKFEQELGFSYQTQASGSQQFADLYDEYNKNEFKQAVYKFISPMCKPIIESGRFNGNFQIFDLYKNSKACNPIYNLENTNDNNLLVYGCQESEQFFITYALNILKKYATQYHYENKICFIKLDDLVEDDYNYFFISFNKTFIFRENQFRDCKRYIQVLPECVSEDYYKLDSNQSYSFTEISQLIKQLRDTHKRLYVKSYDPFLSYINLKVDELYKNERKGKEPLLDFFLGDDGVNTIFESRVSAQINYIKACNDAEYHAYCREAESDFLSVCRDEMEYIRNNGGDWIDD